MEWKNWAELPRGLQYQEIKVYYNILQRKKLQLKIKRIIDVILSALLIFLLFPLFLSISMWIFMDSKGPIFFRQTRITQYGKKFEIIKFRTMVQDADKIGANVTSDEDNRITKVGEKIRKYRLDEIPQLFNIIKGEMTFVGTRPEVPQYVMKYTKEMRATLLLPAGVTSKASIEFKEEEKLLNKEGNVDRVYVETILPMKMKYNLNEIKEFSLIQEAVLICKTVLAVFL